MTEQETITMYIESIRADLMERDRITRGHQRAAHIGLHSSANAPSRRRENMLMKLDELARLTA